MKKENGIVLITVLYMVAVLGALLAAYFAISHLELATVKSTKDSITGFYTAEAGLNLRADEVRQKFVDYNVPVGVSPSTGTPCSAGDTGSGDFACATYPISNHEAQTYVIEDPLNPVNTTIPPGELYQGLNAIEYRYSVTSVGKGITNDTEAILELHFKSRLVPLFQFVAFYDKDLEILPGPDMVLSGPIHTNGDLYTNSDNSITVNGQISTAGDYYRGRKNTNVSNATPNLLHQNSLAGAYAAVCPSCTTRTKMTAAALAPWGSMVQTGVDVLTVPPPEALDPTPGEVYWDQADLRLVLRINASNNVDTTYAATGIEVRDLDNSVNVSATNSINNAATCPGNIGGRAIGTTNSFKNWRENKFIRMLDVDLRSLLNCLHNTSWFGAAKGLDDQTQGGLVIYLTVEGPNSNATANEYGVRLQNGQTLSSNVAGAPEIKGLTVVTNQAAYIKGNYNSTNKKPAAVLCDSINLLSNNQDDAQSANNTVSNSSRDATSTTYNVALLSGTDTTGGTEGTGGQGGAYNGGLENYPRLHENWSGTTLTYRGSFVSLDNPRHVNGGWVYGSPYYTAPTRNWDYDTSFNNAENLPPLSPRFVYLRQELFERQYEK